MNEQKEITIYFDEEVFKKLKYATKRNGITIASFLRDLIKEKYIDNDNVDITINRRGKEDSKKHKYILRVDQKLYKELIVKMEERNDEYFSHLLTELVSKYLKDYFS